MEKKIGFLNKIFEIELQISDIDKEVADVLKWDSFHIMCFMVETEKQFHKKITIQQISEICSVNDLLQLF